MTFPTICRNCAKPLGRSGYVGLKATPPINVVFCGKLCYDEYWLWYSENVIPQRPLPSKPFMPGPGVSICSAERWPYNHDPDDEWCPCTVCFNQRMDDNVEQDLGFA